MEPSAAAARVFLGSRASTYIPVWNILEAPLSAQFITLTFPRKTRTYPRISIPLRVSCVFDYPLYILRFRDTYMQQI